jgi:hypothetical protein
MSINSTSEQTPTIRSHRRRSIPQRYQNNGDDSDIAEEIIDQINVRPSVRRVRRRIAQDFENSDIFPLQEQNEVQRYQLDAENITELGDIRLELDRIIANQAARVYNNDLIERSQREIILETANMYNFRRNYRTSDVQYLSARRGDVSHFIERCNNVSENYCGLMNNSCLYCGAKFFKFERNTTGEYKNCCFKGKFRLPSMSPPTEFMQELFRGNTTQSKLFMKHPRFYNNHLSFASITMDEGNVLRHMITFK